MKKAKQELGPVICDNGIETLYFPDLMSRVSLIKCSFLETTKHGRGKSVLSIVSAHADPQHIVNGRWKPVKMPKEYIINNGPLLRREQVEALINHLQSWLKTGTLSLTQKKK